MPALVLERTSKFGLHSCCGDRQQTHLGRNHEHRLLLTATLIRYQLIMKQVYPAHQELFGKTVRDRVNSETSGTYFSLLMEIMETVETHF